MEMTEATFDDRWRRQRRRALVFLYLAFVLSGTLDGFLMSLPIGSLHPDCTFRVWVLTAILLSLGFLWFCTMDARLVGRPLIEMARLSIFLGWPVGVPIYLVWARGTRGLGLLLFHGILLLFARLGAGLVTWYLVYLSTGPR
jgi:hypothetical protein